MIISRVTLLPRGQLARSGDIFVMTWDGVTCMCWAEARDAAKYPTRHRTARISFIQLKMSVTPRRRDPRLQNQRQYSFLWLTCKKCTWMSKYHVSKSSKEENGFEPVQTWVQILSQSINWLECRFWSTCSSSLILVSLLVKEGQWPPRVKLKGQISGKVLTPTPYCFTQ